MLWFWKLYVMTDYDNGKEKSKAKSSMKVVTPVFNPED